LTSLLNLENSFTSTIASLAPDPSTGEKLLPGGIYVLVSAMAGSIVARNRNILLRATGPIAIGIGAGWVLLPHTMRNVSDLVWKYEEKVPVIAVNHIRVREAVIESSKILKERGEQVSKWTEEKIREGRESVEGWVKKGR
jgi:MICOS complex subunit MIC26